MRRNAFIRALRRKNAAAEPSSCFHWTPASAICALGIAGAAIPQNGAGRPDRLVANASHVGTVGPFLIEEEWPSITSKKYRPIGCSIQAGAWILSAIGVQFCSADDPSSL